MNIWYESSNPLYDCSTISTIEHHITECIYIYVYIWYPVRGTKITPARTASEIWRAFEESRNARSLKSAHRTELASACTVCEGLGACIVQATGIVL